VAGLKLETQVQEWGWVGERLKSMIVFWPPCLIKVDLRIFGRLGSERGGLEHGYG
jgi:hypothetical protein